MDHSYRKQNKPVFNIQLVTLDHNHKIYATANTVHLYHNGLEHFVTTSSTGNVMLYDSLNTKPTQELFQQIAEIHFPNSTILPEVKQSVISHTQVG